MCRRIWLRKWLASKRIDKNAFETVDTERQPHQLCQSAHLCSTWICIYLLHINGRKQETFFKSLTRLLCGKRERRAPLPHVMYQVSWMEFRGRVRREKWTMRTDRWRRATPGFRSQHVHVRFQKQWKRLNTPENISGGHKDLTLERNYRPRVQHPTRSSHLDICPAQTGRECHFRHMGL